MHPRTTRPAAPRALSFAPLFLLASLLLLASALAPPAFATVGSVSTVPSAPTTCDSVALIVEGALPSPCYSILGFRVGAPKPLPTMGPIPTYSLRAVVRVEAPDPVTSPNCATVIPPYRLVEPLGTLPFGRYLVEAHEYVYPFSAADATPVDSSLAYVTLLVGADSCRVGAGCALFGFAEAGTGVEARLGCTARSLAGGRACFDLTLANETPVGAFQTSVSIPPGGDFVDDFASMFVPVEVTATSRAEGFQVAWARDGTRTKIVVFTTTGAVIQPGRGPVLHFCYDVTEGTPEGSYGIGFGPTLVSTSEGAVIPLCPTFAEIQGRLCVGAGGCDLNGDGVGDVRDILRLVRCVLGVPSDACPDSVRAKADCNGDDKIDVRDVVCCVRKSLTSNAGWGPISHVLAAPAPDLSTLRFEGPVEATGPGELRASIALDRSVSFGGVQFTLDPGTTVRVESVSFDDPGRSSALDWQPLSDGRARVMFYDIGDKVAVSSSGSSTGQGAASTAMSVAHLLVALKQIPGTTADGALTIQGVRGATTTGDVLGFTGGVYTIAMPGASEVPTAPAIFPATPNPFRVGTDITYSLPGPGNVSIRLFDVNGRLVRTLQNGVSDGGIQRLHWDGRDDGGRPVGVGIYFVRLAAGNTLRTERILRLR